MKTKDLTVISVSLGSDILWHVVQSRLQESCSESLHGDRQSAVGRPNTTQLLYLSLMAEPDTAVIQLKPLEEWQCPTASPATCTITIKGYYRHSSILCASNWQLTRLLLTSTLSSSVITFSPSMHHLSHLSHLFFLSICPSLSTLHHLMSTHPSITLSLHFIAAQSLFLSGFNLLVDTPLLSVCHWHRHIPCFIFNVMMMQLQMHGISAIKLASWVIHITPIFVFAADLHDLHVQG